MNEHNHDVKKEVRKYLIIFLALGILTIVTVAISYLHFPLTVAIIVALIVAITKGSLVACYFMHLISERKVIYFILVFAVINFLALLLLPYLEFHDVLQGTHNLEKNIVITHNSAAHP